jgi:hypothetical protein
MYVVYGTNYFKKSTSKYSYYSYYLDHQPVGWTYAAELLCTGGWGSGSCWSVRARRPVCGDGGDGEMVAMERWEEKKIEKMERNWMTT